MLSPCKLVTGVLLASNIVWSDGHEEHHNNCKRSLPAKQSWCLSQKKREFLRASFVDLKVLATHTPCGVTFYTNFQTWCQLSSWITQIYIWKTTLSLCNHEVVWVTDCTMYHSPHINFGMLLFSYRFSFIKHLPPLTEELTSRPPGGWGMWSHVTSSRAFVYHYNSLHLITAKCTRT